MEGDVGELELARGVGGDGPVQPADGIDQMNRCSRNHGTGRVADRAAHLARVAALCSRSESREERDDDWENAKDRAGFERHN